MTVELSDADLHHLRASVDTSIRHHEVVLKNAGRGESAYLAYGEDYLRRIAQGLEELRALRARLGG